MKTKKAVSILVAVIVISVVLATGLAVVSIFILELRTSGLASESVQAFYAAEAGIEWRIYEIRKNATASPPVLPAHLSFWFPSTSSTTTLKAIGTFKRGSIERAKRAIEITF